MNKQQAKAAILNGAAIHWHRAGLGIKTQTYVAGERVRVDAARSLIKELSLRGDRQSYATTLFRLPA